MLITNFNLLYGIGHNSESSLFTLEMVISVYLSFQIAKTSNQISKIALWSENKDNDSEVVYLINNDKECQRPQENRTWTWAQGLQNKISWFLLTSISNAPNTACTFEKKNLHLWLQQILESIVEVTTSFQRSLHHNTT